MNNIILETKGLTKIYPGTTALQNVSLTLESGHIYGLIGRNGAGKSTFMRTITGLTEPTEGEYFLFGQNNPDKKNQERRRIGCMIESPSLNPNLSASQNMRHHRLLRGVPDIAIENELLDLVGLSDTGKKKAKDFSLGMKQRLGIAVSLLNSPEFLILDEPINGLDPLGVIEIRNLLIRLCRDQQITILLSSHNLPELYQLATDYIIIDDGRIKQTLSLEQLEERCKQHFLISCTDPERLVSVLELHLHAITYKVMPDKSVKLYDRLDDRETIGRILYENKIILTNFSLEGDTLENYFLSVIGGDNND